MLFTRIAKYLAYIICIFSILRVIMAVTLVENPEALARYTGDTPAVVIDGAIYLMLFGICLGLGAEISTSLGKLVRMREGRGS